MPNLLDLSKTKTLFKVGDVEGHIIDIIQRRVLNFINGEVGTHRNWLTFDTTKGKGTAEGYIQITYEDGSTTFGKFQGTLEPLKVKTFVCTSENALYIQIWTALILDMIIPDMSGGETYDRFKGINPDIKVLLSSGHSINGHATQILERACNGFIQKPFDVNNLLQKNKKIFGQRLKDHL